MAKVGRAHPRNEVGEHRGAPPRGMLVMTARVKVEKLARELAVIIGRETAASVLANAAASLLPAMVVEPPSDGESIAGAA